MPYPACVSQVGDLDGYSVHRGCDFLLTLLRSCVLAFQRDARNVLGEDVSVALSAHSTPQNHILIIRSLFPLFLGLIFTVAECAGIFDPQHIPHRLWGHGGICATIKLKRHAREVRRTGGLPGLSLIIWFKLLCDPTPLENRNVSRLLKLALRGLGRGWLPVIRVLLLRRPFRLSSLSSILGSSFTYVLTICSTSPISIRTFSGFRSV